MEERRYFGVCAETAALAMELMPVELGAGEADRERLGILKIAEWAVYLLGAKPQFLS